MATTEIRRRPHQTIDLTLGDDESPRATPSSTRAAPTSPGGSSVARTDDSATAAEERSWRRIARRVRRGAVTAPEESRVVLGGLTSHLDRPYLTTRERATLRRAMSTPAWRRSTLAEWTDRYVHVDFSALEMWTILPSILASSSSSSLAPTTTTKKIRPDCPHHGANDTISCLRQRVMDGMRGASQHQIERVIRHARNHDRGRLLRPCDEDIQAFLWDAAKGRLSKTAMTIRFGPAPREEEDSLLRRAPTASYPLLLRELGGDDLGMSQREVQRTMEQGMRDSLKLSKTWPLGGSNDVMSVAWNPTGEFFAAGCAALTDEHDMQYNRNKNLLLGWMVDDTLRELPHHRLQRPRPEEGPNATDDMVNALDEWMYCTVASVAFSPGGEYLYTASYDKTVKIWDVDGSRHLCRRRGTTSTSNINNNNNTPGQLLATVNHPGEIDILTTSPHYPTIFITGCKSIQGGVRVYQVEEDEDEDGDLDMKTDLLSSISSKRAMATKIKEIYPSCVKMGLHHSVKHLILAGFSAHDDINSSSSNTAAARDGDLCLFDAGTDCHLRVSPSAQNVFDCTWHSLQPSFAVGCVADSKANRGTRSYVRLYEGLSGGVLVQELECPALDMNEVTWCEDPHYVTASCTDSKTYIWDIRSPTIPLHILSHSESLEPMRIPSDPEYVPAEEIDTGVRFVSWGSSIERFYTGSSDGVVKVWDIRRSPEDVWLRDLITLNSGVMCGAFTEAGDQLLLGDVSGGISLLNVHLEGFDDDDEKVGHWRFVGAE
ncbi:MAG: RNA polymerase III subunit C82 [Watsoniomyces obsoletus]|nr:MAG: RNA polymerase III subunit C82 [Watsoniomyces obsoletus]